MKAALPSFSNRPILAYVIDVDGKPEFNTHAYHLDDDNNVVYDEIPIGIIPESCEAKIAYDEDKEKSYCVVNGYIFEEYAPVAIEILEREEECAVSVELAVRELSYDSKEKILNIDDFFFSGVTVLGKTEDGEEVKPGMAGSNIQLADFSVENNSFTYNNDDLINEITTAVLERLSDNKNQRKEDETVEKDFNEKIEEEVTEEVTEEAATEEETLVVEAETSEEVADEAAEETPEVVEDFEDNNEAENEDTVEETENNEEDDLKKITHSVVYGETTRDFSVSLQDKIYALSTLVNDTYSETDNAWYDVTVYDDEKYVVMKDWWNDKAYKQSYKVKKDVYSLVGDRVEVFAQYLTSDEIKKLDDMRANYAEISEKLAKYEEEPKKVALLNSDDYANIASTEEFMALKKEENHFDMSVEDLKAEADRQLLEYAKGNKIEYAAKPENKSVGVKQFAKKETGKTGRYGKLFKK